MQGSFLYAQAHKAVNAMHSEFTAIIERDGDGFIAYRASLEFNQKR